ncbi:MAG TPA: SDR family oxidoreductase [Gemmatimonadales bacterium]
MSDALEGRVVVITGGSAGVGRAAARAFAGAGADIALLARGEERLEDAQREIEALGRRALAISVDVGFADQVERAAQQIEKTLGPIDIWVNNAMASVFSPVSEMGEDEYRRVTDVTYLGAVYGTMAALRRMKARDRGVIVQVGSALAMRSIPLQSAYCAAKHAMRGFTTSLRSELIHDGSKVRVVMVHMPALNTPQFGWMKSRLPDRAQPVPPIYQPEVAANAILYAATHDVGREILVGLPTVKAVVGNKVAPGFLDRYLAAHGFDDQQTDEPEVAGRPDNLWKPVAGNQAAHGAFDNRAHGSSFEFWLRVNRRALFLAGLGVAGAAAIATTLARKRRRHSAFSLPTLSRR